MWKGKVFCCCCCLKERFTEIYCWDPKWFIRCETTACCNWLPINNSLVSGVLTSNRAWKIQQGTHKPAKETVSVDRLQTNSWGNSGWCGQQRGSALLQEGTQQCKCKSWIINFSIPPFWIKNWRQVSPNRRNIVSILPFLSTKEALKAAKQHNNIFIDSKTRERANRSSPNQNSPIYNPKKQQRTILCNQN